MKNWLKLLLIPLALVVAIGIIWRFISRRRSLPCPFWLAWLLENRYTEAVASSRVLLNRLNLQPGMRVLDVGCGPGRLSLPAAKQVGPDGEILALDIQAEMLHRLRKRARDAGLRNIYPIHACIGAGTLEPGAFDRAILTTVLGEIPDREAALAEIFQTLKPGGVLSVTEVIPDPHYQSRRTVRRLALDAGFEEKRYFGNWLAFTLNFTKPADT